MGRLRGATGPALHRRFHAVARSKGCLQPAPKPRSLLTALVQPRGADPLPLLLLGDCGEGVEGGRERMQSGCVPPGAHCRPHLPCTVILPVIPRLVLSARLCA